MVLANLAEVGANGAIQHLPKGNIVEKRSAFGVGIRGYQHFYLFALRRHPCSEAQINPGRFHPRFREGFNFV